MSLHFPHLYQYTVMFSQTKARHSTNTFMLGMQSRLLILHIFYIFSLSDQSKSHNKVRNVTQRYRTVKTFHLTATKVITNSK